MPTAETVMPAPQAINEVEPYSELKAKVEEAKAQNAALAFNYRDPKGEKDARSHIHGLRRIKGDIDRRRKDLKAEALAYGKRVDGAAKALTAEVEDMIRVHQEPLNQMAEEERQRVAKIKEGIDNIIQTGCNLGANPSSGEIAAAIEWLEAVVIEPEKFHERMADATQLKAKMLQVHRDAYELAVKREAEAAELEKLRREKAEREQRDRDERIAREAQERARRQAEQKAEAEREAAQRREREAAEREARLKAEAEAADRRAAEAEQRAREQAELEAKRRAEQEAAEAERRRANEEHAHRVKSEIAAAIQKAGEVNEDQANEIVDALARGRIPHTQITF